MVGYADTTMLVSKWLLWSTLHITCHFMPEHKGFFGNNSVMQ